MSTDEIKNELSVDNIRGNRMEGVAKEILNIDPEDTISDEDLQLVFDLNLEFQMKELTISSGEKRQLFQFEPNDYHASVKIDLSNSWKVVFDRVKNVPPEERPDEYMKCKKIFYELIKAQYKKHENFLRALIQTQELEDGIKR